MVRVCFFKYNYICIVKYIVDRICCFDIVVFFIENCVNVSNCMVNIWS